MGDFHTRWSPLVLVAIPGFLGTDTHHDVIVKGAKGLGIESSPNRLHLLVSNCLVKDARLPSGQPWTLENYIRVWWCAGLP